MSMRRFAFTSPRARRFCIPGILILCWTNIGLTPAGFAAEAGVRTASPPRVLAPAGDMRGAIGDSFLLAMPDGAIHLVFARRTPHAAELASQYTRDNGRTWSAPAQFCPMETRNLGPALPLLTTDGQVQLFWMVERRSGDTPAIDYFIDIWHARSCPLPGAWSKPQRIFAGYVGSLNGMTQLAGGRIVLPFASWLAGVPAGPPHGNNAVTTIYSDDQGVTWRQSPAKLTAPCLPDYNGDNLGAVEPTILQLADGRVWMLIRTQTGRLYESFSPDGAEWQPAAPSRFCAPDAPAWLLRLPDRRIVLFWNNCENTSRVAGEGVYCNRDALHAAISADEGKTWRGYREIYRDPLRNASPPKTGDRGTAYPYPIATRDGKIMLVTGQGPGRRNILFVDPQWLLQTTAACDFSSGLDEWCAFKAFGPATNWWRDRVPGAQLVPHPHKPGVNVLHVRRPDEKNPDGAVWNFPCGHSGQLTLRLLVQPGCQGASIALADRFIQPTDDVGERKSLFVLPIAGDGRLTADAALTPGKWHALTMQWNLTRRHCQFFVDGQPAGEIAAQTNVANCPGVSYLRLRSTAGTADTAGMLIESVRADVGNVDPSQAADAAPFRFGSTKSLTTSHRVCTVTPIIKPCNTAR